MTREEFLMGGRHIDRIVIQPSSVSAYRVIITTKLLFGVIEMKPIKVDNEDILKAVSSGTPYIEIGNRKFMLFEAEETSETVVMK